MAINLPSLWIYFSTQLKLLNITISKKGIKKRATKKVTHFGQNQNDKLQFNILYTICQEKLLKKIVESSEKLPHALS